MQIFAKIGLTQTNATSKPIQFTTSCYYIVALYKLQLLMKKHTFLPKNHF